MKHLSSSIKTVGLPAARAGCGYTVPVLCTLKNRSSCMNTRRHAMLPIRGFCIGKKNWEMIDTVNGATSSAIIYSIAETAKANQLKPYEYFEYLLTEIPKHMDDKNSNFLEELLPWSETLPENIRKPQKTDEK